MELKEYLLLLIRYIKLILIFTLVGGLFGLVCFYLLKPDFIATGTYYVSRIIEPDGGAYHFNYEGYYAQQAANNYAQTFAYLLESEHVLNQTLTKRDLETTAYNIAKLKRRVNVKAESQLVTLSFKDEDPKIASNTWEYLTAGALDTVIMQAPNSDPYFRVIPLVERPIVYQQYSSAYLNLVIGLILGSLLGILVVSFKEYLGIKGPVLRFDQSKLRLRLGGLNKKGKK